MEEGPVRVEMPDGSVQTFPTMEAAQAKVDQWSKFSRNGRDPMSPYQQESGLSFGPQLSEKYPKTMAGVGIAGLIAALFGAGRAGGKAPTPGAQGVADSAGFDRALQGEMDWIARMKATNPNQQGNFLKQEFPPGASQGTSPVRFKQLLDKSAESQGDPNQVKFIQDLIAKALGPRK